MSDEPVASTFCEERKRLDHELSMLLNSKCATREQITNEVIPNPSKRRATLVRTNEMIDDVIALMNDHHKHCSCERRGSVAELSSSAPGHRQLRTHSGGSLNRIFKTRSG